MALAWRRVDVDDDEVDGLLVVLAVLCLSANDGPVGTGVASALNVATLGSDSAGDTDRYAAGLPGEYLGDGVLMVGLVCSDPE